MTVADLLSLMSTFDNEVDTSAGGSDETSSIAALNAALQHIQAICAAMPEVLSSRGANPLQTAANVETTPLPNELLRIDALWMLDSTTLFPIYRMGKIQEVGGQSPSIPLISNTTQMTSPGRPSSYYMSGDAIYWDPLPDSVYLIRAYGLWSRQSFVDRHSQFVFPDTLSLSFATFASRYTKMALDDDASDISKLAAEVFTPALRALRRRDRSGPTSRQYAYDHHT